MLLLLYWMTFIITIKDQPLWYATQVFHALSCIVLLNPPATCAYEKSLELLEKKNMSLQMLKFGQS